MSNLHRIRWIDSRIREGLYPNCRTISERFEISARQASRDIEYLRYSLGAPVEYSAEKNGYYYADSSFEMPSLFISDVEKQVLSYLAYRYQEAGSDQARMLAGLFSRLSGDSFVSKGVYAGVPVYGIRPGETRIFSTIRQAASVCGKVEMEYLNARNEMSRRIFRPYKIFTVEQNTHVVGYCELRREIRIFRLDRIRGVNLTGESFSIPSSFRPDDYSDYSAFNRRDPYIARVRFDAAPDARGFKVNMLSSDEKVYKVSFHDSEEMLSMLLAQRTGFSIIHPNWLREKLLAKITNIADKNA